MFELIGKPGNLAHQQRLSLNAVGKSTRRMFCTKNKLDNLTAGCNEMYNITVEFKSNHQSWVTEGA